MQNAANQSIAYDYAAGQGEYGGMYHDGDLLVVLFTGQLARHEAALRVRLVDPDLVAVLPTDRTWNDLVAAQQRLETSLHLGPDAPPEVMGVGIGRHDNGFAIVVDLDPYNLESAAAVARLAAPEQVQFCAYQPVHLPGPISRRPRLTA